MRVPRIAGADELATQGNRVNAPYGLTLLVSTEFWKDYWIRPSRAEARD